MRRIIVVVTVLIVTLVAIGYFAFRNAASTTTQPSPTPTASEALSSTQSVTDTLKFNTVYTFKKTKDHEVVVTHEREPVKGFYAWRAVRKVDGKTQVYIDRIAVDGQGLKFKVAYDTVELLLFDDLAGAKNQNSVWVEQAKDSQNQVFWRNGDDLLENNTGNANADPKK